MRKNNYSGKRINAIDWLKGICIILIIFTHCDWGNTEIQSYYFGYWVDMAVPILMICSGYVWSESFKRKSIDSLEKGYKKEILMQRLVRFILPYTFVFWYYERYQHTYFPDRQLTIWGYIGEYVRGDIGLGGYYFPVMIQLVFLFPCLFILIYHYGKKGLMVSFMLNFVFELCSTLFFLNEACYRLLVFRYIFVICAGIYCSLNQWELGWWQSLLLMLAGGIFIYAIYYTDYEPFIFTLWSNTSMIASLWIMPIVLFTINHVNIKLRLLQLIGKASYHIFLVQMFFFASFFGKGLLLMLFDDYRVRYALTIVECVVVGVTFYLVEKGMYMIFYWGRDRFKQYVHE